MGVLKVQGIKNPGVFNYSSTFFYSAANSTCEFALLTKYFSFIFFKFYNCFNRFLCNSIFSSIFISGQTVAIGSGFGWLTLGVLFYWFWASLLPISLTRRMKMMRTSAPTRVKMSFIRGLSSSPYFPCLFGFLIYQWSGYSEVNSVVFLLLCPFLSKGPSNQLSSYLQLFKAFQSLLCLRFSRGLSPRPLGPGGPRLSPSSLWRLGLFWERAQRKRRVVRIKIRDNLFIFSMCNKYSGYTQFVSILMTNALSLSLEVINSRFKSDKCCLQVILPHIMRKLTRIQLINHLMFTKLQRFQQSNFKKNHFQSYFDTNIQRLYSSTKKGRDRFDSILPQSDHQTAYSVLQDQSISNIFQMSIEQDKHLRVDFDKLQKRAAYGTAGFRDLAVNMPYIAFRVGVLVAILNKTQPYKHLGIVISASHNKREDNGVKITNFRGNMLEKDFEPKVEDFVNEQDLEVAVKTFKEYLVGKGLTIYEAPVTVLIGGDTRPSTEPLLALLADGIKYEKGNALNFHLTTTPQLQYYVYLANVELKKLITDTQEVRPLFEQNFSRYFTEAADFLGWKNAIHRTIDCANGIGAKAMPKFNNLIKNYIVAELSNTSDDQFLNKDCGADHVKTKKILPRNFQRQPHDSYLSFDGDADRIVFYTETDGKLNLIDGDRTGTVLTEFFNRISKDLKSKTDKLNETEVLLLNIPTEPTIGFVQTYYANYSSSEYLQKTFGMKPLFAATGVKNLHEKAEHYDIGIYFQANGHGTVIFNENYLQRLQALLNGKEFLFGAPSLAERPDVMAELEEYFKFLQFYINVCKLSNPSVGDAICVFLLFELALFYLKKDYKDTLKLYQDLQSLTSKIAVKAKEALKVTEIEDKVVEPAGLQDRIQAILEKHKGKKAFLRASGTENVLRLHVEADTVEQVKAITEEVKEIVISNPVLN